MAIHQPNFFPWLGYFDKLLRADHFVILDHVQQPKGGGTWMNRVKICVQGDAQWLTAPLDRKSKGFHSIGETEFSREQNWRDKMIRTIRLNYAAANFFHESFDLIKGLVANPEDNVVEYNLASIRGLANHIGLSLPSLRLSSDLGAQGSSTELLVELTKLTDGNVYLSGDGAEGYLDCHLFGDKSGVSLVFQRFRHPTYKTSDGKDCIPGLSIIDALMHLGPTGLRDLLLEEAASNV